MIFVCNIPSSTEDIWCKGKKKSKKPETLFHNKIQSGKSSLVCWDVFGFRVTWTVPPWSGISWWAPYLWPRAPQGRGFVPTRKRLLNMNFVTEWAFDDRWSTAWETCTPAVPSTLEHSTQWITSDYKASFQMLLLLESPPHDPPLQSGVLQYV